MVSPFLADWIRSAGLRSAGPGIGLVMLAVLVPAILGLVRTPGAHAAPDPAPPDTESLGAAPAPEVVERAGPPTSPARSAGRAEFAAITLAFALMLLSQVSVITMLLSITDERSISGSALALSAVAASSVAGRLLGIPLLVALGLRTLSVGVGGLQAIAMWVVAGADSTWLLVVGAVLLGLTVGNVVILLPLWMLAAFGRTHYGPLYSRANLLTTLGVASGPSLLALLHAGFGAFGLPLVIFGLGSAVAATLLLRVGPIDDVVTSP
jgi:hypothetical protein